MVILNRFPMVRYCKETKRIVCGCHNGRLVMYEFKTSKWNFQSYPAHNNQPIAAVAVSGDSKYIASYSAHDNSLIFWQVLIYHSPLSLYQSQYSTILNLKRALAETYSTSDRAHWNKSSIAMRLRSTWTCRALG